MPSRTFAACIIYLAAFTSCGGVTASDEVQHGPDGSAGAEVPPARGGTTPPPGVETCKTTWTPPNYGSAALNSNWSCMVVPAFKCGAGTTCCAAECITSCDAERLGFCLELTPRCVMSWECRPGGELPYLGPDAGGTGADGSTDAGAEL